MQVQCPDRSHFWTDTPQSFDRRSKLCFCPNIFQQWLQKTFLLDWEQPKSLYNMDKKSTEALYSGCSSDHLNTSTVFSKHSSRLPCPALFLTRVEARAFFLLLFFGFWCFFGFFFSFFNQKHSQNRISFLLKEYSTWITEQTSWYPRQS